MYLPQAWSIAQRALASAGQAPAAEQVLRKARQWIGAAANELPPEYREGFIQRNAVNRALLAMPVTAG
jgi:hypothetical protein